MIASAARIPVAESKVMNRFDFTSSHPMPPPYVVKPVNEGSSFGVVIVKGDQPHPPQIITSAEWAYGDTVMVERYVYGRELTCAVMGDVALGVTEILPVGQPSTITIRNTFAGRIKTRMPGKNFTENLPKDTDTVPQGASSDRLPGREPFRLPVRRPVFRGWRADLARDQHAARHDADVAGAGNRAGRGHSFGELVELDGGGRIVHALNGRTSHCLGAGRASRDARHVVVRSCCRASCASLHATRSTCCTATWSCRAMPVSSRPPSSSA